jgi:hypothetical protein
LTLQITEAELASQGFFVLIGRDILDSCVLTYDGPRSRFTLEYEVP